MKIKNKRDTILLPIILGLLSVLMTACPGSHPDSGVKITCEEVNCRLVCDNGFEIGDDGCEICACAQVPLKSECDPYSNINECSLDQYCEFVGMNDNPNHINGFQAEIVYYGVCVDK